MDQSCPVCGSVFDVKGLTFKTWPGKYKYLPQAIGWGCPKCGVLLTMNTHPAETRMKVIILLMLLAALLLLAEFGLLAFLAWAMLIPLVEWAFQRWARLHLAAWKRYARADWSGRKRSD